MYLYPFSARKMANNTPMAVNNEVIALEGGGGAADPIITSISEVPPIGEEAEEDEGGLEDSNRQDEMGVRHCFYDFCKQTILHGWHYLADLEQEPTPASPSFVTFTPVSSPNTALPGEK